jgi:hypothetical protein
MRKDAERLYVATDNMFGCHGALRRSVVALMGKVTKIMRDRKEGRKHVTDEDAK